MDKIQVGLKIANYRKEKGFTQKDLAEKLGVTDKSVSKWETGVNFPDVAILETLAEELGITVLELLDLETSSADEIVKEMTEFSEVQRKMALERERISKTEIVLISIFLIVGEWIFLSLMLSFFDGWTGVILGVAFFTSVEIVICTAMIINSIRKNR
ncbi:MAG: helix-turn-helix domain-containing protein [Lachnospiraceae bacterium]|nr:helix-turn-helix domain-containing protein [Lachnospiraceae bacterium]